MNSLWEFDDQHHHNNNNNNNNNMDMEDDSLSYSTQKFEQLWEHGSDMPEISARYLSAVLQLLVGIVYISIENLTADHFRQITKGMDMFSKWDQHFRLQPLNKDVKFGAKWTVKFPTCVSHYCPSQAFKICRMMGDSLDDGMIFRICSSSFRKNPWEQNVLILASTMINPYKSKMQLNRRIPTLGIFYMGNLDNI